MIEKLPSLMQLLKQLHYIPYLASKNLYRVANFLLVMDERKMQQLCDALLDAKRNIVLCSDCFAWQERGAACVMCADPKRDASIICVVETWQDMITIEKTGGYRGLYHVLGGSICPLDGIGPENLSIEPLVRRVREKNVLEIILATNPTPEGEATAAFIANKLKGISLNISCLARGVPVGSSLEFMDRLTVVKALSERKPF